jgi:hypothetical protein
VAGISENVVKPAVAGMAVKPEPLSTSHWIIEPVNPVNVIILPPVPVLLPRQIGLIPPVMEPPTGLKSTVKLNVLVAEGHAGAVA